MSHQLAVSDAQRVHLAVAEADAAKLTRALRSRRTRPFTTAQWLATASLAAAVADQLDQGADLAARENDRWVWSTSARLVRDTGARFELWASLADSEQANSHATPNPAREVA